MDEGRRRELRRKYLNLGVGELAATAVFVAAAIFSVAPRLRGPEHWALWAALTPLCVLLVQAGAYWLLARRWVLPGGMPPSLAAAYRAFRVLDVGLLAVGLAAVAWAWPDRAGVAVLVLAVWLFAVVEYVNYFVVRLSYPIHVWFAEVTRRRTPRLVLDLTVSPRPSAEETASPAGCRVRLGRRGWSRLRH